MEQRRLNDLFQSFYSDESFRINLINAPDETLLKGGYLLTDEEKHIVKQFISKDWSNQSIHYKTRKLSDSSEGCGCGGCHPCSACACHDLD